MYRISLTWLFENKSLVEKLTKTEVLVQYLQTAVAHPEAHGVHVDVIWQRRARRLTVILRKLLHKWRWSALVFED